MTPSTEWPASDQGNVATPDLFGGELFGDELIDMYNADAVVGNDDGDIPSLLPPGPNSVDGSGDLNHPGAQVALAAAAIDDGFGAFRPSTSFNDLTALLPESNESAGTSSDSVAVSVPSPTKSGGRKRAASGSKASELPQKKRATAQKPRNNASNRRSSAKTNKADNPANTPALVTSAGHVALKLRKEQQALLQGQAGKSVNNTPNPLSGVAAGPVPKTITVNHSAKPVAVGKPSVVTPRPISSAKGESITSEAAAAAAVVAAASVRVPPQAPVSSSESDFSSVAQAAVTNLILNVGSTKAEGKPCSNSFKVDTSTAHIKALTSTNWVSACSGSSSDDGGTGSTDSKANKARRQNLTPDERARQNRDRNREHARNTRLRKKAYVEELKRVLTELVSQRDAAEADKRHSAQRELEQREVRFRVMEEFLKLRGRNESSFARWAAILVDGFTLTLPVTDFRKMVEKGESGTPAMKQVLRGTSEAMGDAAHLAAFFQTLGNGSDGPDRKGSVAFLYNCDRKNFFMDGCNAILMWTGSTIGAVGEGAPMELTLSGSMHAKFSPASNKLISADIMFDTGIIATQLQLLDSPKTDYTEESDKRDAIAAAAAQAAANEADALLDSLQMPHLGTAIPTAITLVPSGDIPGTASVAVSVTSSDKDDSSDESLGDGMAKPDAMGSEGGIAMRRSTRRKE